ncbi:MAG TPA: hypothetical protein VKU87_05675, partial [Thermomicrobiaceae bacterium]|nr:hypothetical protein [Thermomicrobiaceae bacterium]
MEMRLDRQPFMRLLSRARAASDAEIWTEAIPLWEEVTSRNPVDGSFWRALGEARLQGAQYEQAISALQRSVELGAGFPAEAVYGIARCRALMSQTEAALASLEEAFQRGFRHVELARSDAAFRPLRDEPRFRRLIGPVNDGPLSRDERWRVDLDWLVHEIKRLGFAPFHYVSEATFDETAGRLRAAIPGLTDAGIVVEMMKLMRLVDDGHTRLRSIANVPGLQQTLPLQFYLFEEGLFITAADPAYLGLLGSQVLSFAGTSVEALFDALEPLISRDNQEWLKQMTPYHLRELPLLHALGLVPEPDRVELRLMDQSGKERVEPVAVDSNHPDIWYAMPAPTSWVFLPDTIPGETPRYLHNAGVAYWFDYLADERLVYFQFNRVSNDVEESLEHFAARLFDFVERNPVEKLVIDLRWNNGGNTLLELPLLHRLIGCDALNQLGRLFVIIGRRTFSAA